VRVRDLRHGRSVGPAPQRPGEGGAEVPEPVAETRSRAARSDPEREA
jgi:hypothetical protein